MQQHLDVLPTDAIQRAAWLRLAFYKKSDVTKYLNEAINMLNVKSAHFSINHSFY